MHGTVHVQFVIGPQGTVLASNVGSSTLGHASTEACIVAATRRWQYPQPEGGGIVPVLVDLTFTNGEHATGEPTAVGDWVLTRLHARARLDASTLHFRRAEAIEGGREREPTEHDDPTRPRFETRYVVRHAWEGETACPSPVRDVWGAPATGQPPDPVAATRGATPVDDDTLASAFPIALDALGLAPPPPPPPALSPPPSPSPPPSLSPAPPPAGCGCRAGAPSASGLLALALVSLAIAGRRMLRA
jgi:TonB family protein